MDTLKIGVIGTGHMGRNHVRILSEDKRFDFIGIFDINTALAEEIAKQYDVRLFADVDSLLKNTEAVIIAVPSIFHKEVALKAAEYGVDALIEKPLSTNSKDAKEIMDVYCDRGLKLAVGHIERFNPVFCELQKLVNPDDIIYIEACRYSPFSASGRITDTSVVEDLMIHDVDLVCALMSGKELTSIHGRGESANRSEEVRSTDFATCLMDFGGRCHAVVNASRISQNKERTITIHTVDSCIHADLLAKTLKIFKSTNLLVELEHDNFFRQEGIVQQVFVPIKEPLKAELIAFYDAIVNNVPIEVNGEVGYKAVKICEEVAERAKY